jgi:hypothetical protein
LDEALAAGLDAALLSDDPASAGSPAGLLAGAIVVTPSTPPNMVADLAALVAALSAGAQPAFIAAPATALKIAMGGGQPVPYPVATSASMAADAVVAIDGNALVVASSPPTTLISENALLNMTDAPGQIIDGPPAVYGVPSRSLWQDDLVAARLVAYADWVLRAPAAVVQPIG